MAKDDYQDESVEEADEAVVEVEIVEPAPVPVEAKGGPSFVRGDDGRLVTE